MVSGRERNPMETGHMSLRIDQDIQRRIEAFARERGSTPADVVREAFEAYEARQNGEPDEGAKAGTGATVYDRWSRLGFIGCVQGDADSPTDLSTNAKYMEGFGVD
jgi:hypothetical protein